MSFIFKLVKTNKVTISIFIVSTSAIYLLFKFIFWSYPEFIRNVFYNYACPKTEGEFTYNIGTFGDMYGGLNAFLSGLAFIGAVIAIILQVYQINSEKRKHEEEIKVQLNLFKWHLDKLKSKYLESLKTYLNWNGVSYSLKRISIDFKDDYSFKELLSINIFDLYRGFAAIGKIEQADKLIEFIQLLKQIHEFYSGVVKFRSDCENSIQDAKDLVIEKGKILFKELKLLEVTAFESEIHDFINDFSDRLKDLDPVLLEAISDLTQYIDYSNALSTYEIERDVYRFDTENRLDKITEIETLIDNLSRNIPTMNSSV